MNIFKNLITSSIIATIALSASAQADEFLDIFHPESADLFHFDNSLKPSKPSGTFSLNDDYGKQAWSYEYEEYVIKDDFSNENNIINNTQLVNRYLKSNPTASGKPSDPVFKWDSSYDGFMLQ